MADFQTGDQAFNGWAADQGGFIPIYFQMDGQRELIRNLATWGAQIEDMTPAWEDVGREVLLPDFAAQFETEGNWLGAQVAPPWEPLRPSTVAQRGSANPILVRTGALRASATEEGAPGNIFAASATGLTIGTNYPTAAYHHYGTRRMVMRRFIALRFDPDPGGRPSGRSGIIAVLNRFVQQQARLAGVPLRGGPSGIGEVIE